MRKMREKDGELLKVKCITARRTAETGERGREEESTEEKATDVGT
jgi:hypothetical protein